MFNEASIRLKQLCKICYNLKGLDWKSDIGHYGMLNYSRFRRLSSKNDRVLEPIAKDAGLFNKKTKSLEKKELPKKRSMSVNSYLAQVLSVDQEIVAIATGKHPKKRFIQLKDVMKAVKYLQEMGFERDVIIESLAICFYPIENIEYGFKQISQNEAELREVGLINGFVLEETNSFRTGTHSRDKRLQLCLYYMELPFCFSGSGIFNVGYT